MGLFDGMLEKLGIKKAEAAPTPKAQPYQPTLLTPIPESAKVAPLSAVDVVAKLDGLARANPQQLNWKTSIVDLMKLLDMDSSLTARKELATELGCPADLMGDSAKMNMWLHKTVLAKIGEYGGNVPPELLG
jgi:hypothetical protein